MILITPVSRKQTKTTRQFLHIEPAAIAICVQL
jgi:hypothetical protein